MDSYPSEASSAFRTTQEICPSRLTFLNKCSQMRLLRLMSPLLSATSEETDEAILRQVGR